MVTSYLHLSGIVFTHTFIAYIYFFQALKKYFHFIFIIPASCFEKGRIVVLHMEISGWCFLNRCNCTLHAFHFPSERHIFRPFLNLQSTVVAVCTMCFKPQILHFTHGQGSHSFLFYHYFHLFFLYLYILIFILNIYK
jgi:hypothetical protein